MPVNQLLKRSFPWAYSLYVDWQRKTLPERVSSILSSTRPSVYLDSEDLFLQLQSEYAKWWPEYEYDPFNNWTRAVSRQEALFKYECLRGQGLKVLESGCGDGVTGYLLKAYGHKVVLCDIEDWREERARAISFVRADMCGRIPLRSSQFDLILSYNAFEHVPDPRSTLLEFLRVCKPHGYIFIDFNPLYCSALGLHAFCFTFPYPQFLFSPQFIESKVRILGVRDLGRISYSLQPTNKWRLNQYRDLWTSPGFETVSLLEEVDARHLSIVESFPKAFRGQGLTIDDLITSHVTVLLRKKS